jgi:hypothetical protein
MAMGDNSDDLWGPIKLDDWEKVLFIKDRIATEEDVKSGRAVFYVKNDEVNEYHQPIDIEIPSLAYHVDETGERKMVVMIQTETTGEQELAGIRFFEGGNGVCMLDELEFIKQE